MSALKSTCKAHQRQSSRMLKRRQARRAAMKTERNKVRNILRHLKAHPWDRGAIDSLQKLADKLFGLVRVSIPSPTESPKQARGKLGLTLTMHQDALRPRKIKVAPAATLPDESTPAHEHMAQPQHLGSAVVGGILT